MIPPKPPPWPFLWLWGKKIGMMTPIFFNKNSLLWSIFPCHYEIPMPKKQMALPWCRSQDLSLHLVSSPIMEEGCFNKVSNKCHKDWCARQPSVIGQEEEKIVSNHQQVCLTMQHNDFDNGQILHAVTWFCNATEEGPVKSLFNILAVNNNVENNENVAIGGDENIFCEIPSVLNDARHLKFLSTRIPYSWQW